MKLGELKKEFEEGGYWGLSAMVDLHSCNLEFIRDREKIKEFIDKLCKRIKMKKFGNPIIVHFGKGEIAGYSAVQLIETSLISAHFANQDNNAFLDIFSCKFFNPFDAAEFAGKFFKSRNYNLKYRLRK